MPLSGCGKARFAGWGRAVAAAAAAAEEVSVESAANALDRVNRENSAAAVVLANEIMSDRFPCGCRRSPGNSIHGATRKAQAMVADALIPSDVT